MDIKIRARAIETKSTQGLYLESKAQNVDEDSLVREVLDKIPIEKMVGKLYEYYSGEEILEHLSQVDVKNYVQKDLSNFFTSEELVENLTLADIQQALKQKNQKNEPNGD